jgi:hypothetical protein
MGVVVRGGMAADGLGGMAMGGMTAAGWGAPWCSWPCGP